MKIRGANIFVPDYNKAATGILLLTAVRNDGNPTTLRDWALDVTLEGELPRRAVFHRLGTDKAIRLRGPAGAAVIRSADGLQGQTENKELIAGGEAEGQLFFELPNTRKDDVVRETTRLVLSATDNRGTLARTVETIASISRNG